MNLSKKIGGNSASNSAIDSAKYGRLLRTDLLDGEFDGDFVTGQITTGIAVGAVCMPTAANTWGASSANGANNRVRGLKLNDTDVLLNGFYRNDTWNFAINAPLWLDVLAGVVTETPQVATDDYVVPVGYAFTSNIIRLEPSLVRGKHV